MSELKAELIRLLKSPKHIDCLAIQKFFSEIGPARVFDYATDQSAYKGTQAYVRLITPWSGKEMMDRFKPWFDANPWPFFGYFEISVGESRKITPRVFYTSSGYLRNAVQCCVSYDGTTRKIDWKNGDLWFGKEYTFEDGVVWHYQDPAWIEKWRVIMERREQRYAIHQYAARV